MDSASVSSSSSTASPHSSICTHSVPSFVDSIPSSQSNSSSRSTGCETRCEGLDLLVKAVYYVAGSMVGVPFTQRRVITRRRRRRTLVFNNFTINEIFKKEEQDEEEEKVKKADKEAEAKSKSKRKNRVMALPLKYQDSVLQPWKRQSRCRRRSFHIGDGSGACGLGDYADGRNLSRFSERLI